MVQNSFTKVLPKISISILTLWCTLYTDCLLDSGQNLSHCSHSIAIGKKNINNVLSFRQFSLQVGHRFFVDPLLMALRTLKYIIYSPVGFNHYVVWYYKRNFVSIHSFILRIYIAPPQETYSGMLPFQPRLRKQYFKFHWCFINGILCCSHHRHCLWQNIETKSSV